MESGLGCALIGAGPMATVGICLLKKPFLPLVSLTTCFVYLTAFVVASIPWALARGSVDRRDEVLFGMLATAVAAQEGTRWILLKIQERAIVWLDRLSRKEGLGPLRENERLRLAVAVGYGHGITTTLFFFLSLLPLSFPGGTFYLESCPQLDFFTAAACCSLAFGLSHTFSSPLFTDGCRKNNSLHKYLPTTLHVAMSLITLGNRAQGGCMVVIPLLFCATLIPSFLAWRLYRTNADWIALSGSEGGVPG